MAIPLSFESIPELAGLPPDERARVWHEQCRLAERRWQTWAAFAGMGILMGLAFALIGGILDGIGFTRPRYLDRVASTVVGICFALWVWPRTFHRMIRTQLRARVGLCRTCGYDLRATPGRCPECGAEATGAVT